MPVGLLGLIDLGAWWGREGIWEEEEEGCMVEWVLDIILWLLHLWEEMCNLGYIPQTLIYYKLRPKMDKFEIPLKKSKTKAPVTHNT